MAAFLATSASAGNRGVTFTGRAPGNPQSARTLGIAFADAGHHLAHGDFLGTCEFVNSGGASRAAALRERLTRGYSADPNAKHIHTGPDSNPYFTPAAPAPRENPAGRTLRSRGAREHAKAFATRTR